jgi:hypothetical protein
LIKAIKNDPFLLTPFPLEGYLFFEPQRSLQVTPGINEVGNLKAGRE